MRTCSLPAGPVRQGKEGGPVQEPPAQGQVGMGGGGGTYGTAESSVYSWKEGRAGVIQTKWRCSGAVLLVNIFMKLSSPAPTRDRALIVYRLLVRLSL